MVGLRERLGESTQAVRRNKLVGMLRSGAHASLTSGAKNGEGGEGATSGTAKVLEAFGAATQNERDIIWSGMAQSVTLKQRVALHVKTPA